MRFKVILDGVPARSAELAAGPYFGQIFQVVGGPFAQVANVTGDGDGSRVIRARRIGPPRTFPVDR